MNCPSCIVLFLKCNDKYFLQKDRFDCLKWNNTWACNTTLHRIWSRSCLQGVRVERATEAKKKKTSCTALLLLMSSLCQHTTKQWFLVHQGLCMRVFHTVMLDWHAHLPQQSVLNSCPHWRAARCWLGLNKWLCCSAVLWLRRMQYAQDNDELGFYTHTNVFLDRMCAAEFFL